VTTGALLLLAGAVFQQADTLPVRRVETLLGAGELREARSLIERDWARYERDARALLLLGRVHLDWPVVGRYRAWRLFRRAAEADPDNPEPHYWQAKVGLALGDDEGGSLVRRALVRLWQLAPDYRDSWEMWEQVYHGGDHLRDAIATLALHPGSAQANFRRGQLLVELGDRTEAVRLFDSLIAGGRDDAAIWALHAQALLAAGEDDRGMASYERALARAASDSLEILWRQVRAIATPDEDSAYAATALADREAFFRAFWASREPDLTTAQNERVAEHFQRLAYAREHYRLLHPQSRYHSSPTWRAVRSIGLDDSSAARLMRSLHEFYLPDVQLPGFSRFEEEMRMTGVGTGALDIVEPDSLTRYRRYGLDGRGLLYLRFGEPVQHLIDHRYGLEAWEYDVDGQRVAVTLARRSAGHWGGGDMIFVPLSRTIAHNSMLMLERDATAIEADAHMEAWAATFRGPAPGWQAVYVRTGLDSSVAVLWDADWHEVARSEDQDLHVLRAGAGQHHLGLDARKGDALARIRSDYFVRPLWTDHLLLSSILLAPGDLAGAERSQMAHAMPADLDLPVGVPLSLYAEIYGLEAGRDRLAVYEVEYRFEPLDGGDPVTLVFQRSTRWEPAIVERIVVEPGRVPPGRYRIVLTVRDRVDPAVAETSRIDVTLR
jgi:tetratricopeptide (TPR) repeat protein